MHQAYNYFVTYDSYDLLNINPAADALLLGRTKFSSSLKCT